MTAPGTSGHSSPTAPRPHRAPSARRARIPLLPGLLQARDRHHAPYTVVRRTQGGGSPRTDDPRRHHAVRKGHVSRTGGFPAYAGRRRHGAARHSSCLRPITDLTLTISPSSAPGSGRSSPRATAPDRGVRGTSWWEFVAPSSGRASYQKFLAAGITRSLVAAKARTASTRTIGDVFVQLMLTIVNPTGDPRSRARRADESRLDRSLARVSRIYAGCGT